MLRLAIASFICAGLRTFLASFSSFGITLRLRHQTFNKLMKLPMSYYDDTKNQSFNIITSKHFNYFYIILSNYKLINN